LKRENAEERGVAAYLIVEVTDISDPEQVGQYAEQVVPVVERYGGRYIARGPAQLLEGEHQSQVVVIVEFPSMEQLQAMYDSDDYAPLKALRQSGSTCNFIGVAGS
jgi:uncharacterized protein (DUF1330 family)